MPEPGHISQQDPYLITLSADLDGNGKTDTFTGTRQQLLDERNQVQALLDASKGQLQLTTDYLHDQRVPSPFVLQTTTITNGSQTFTYTSETLNWGITTWPSILPEGGIAVPTSADVVALF